MRNMEESNENKTKLDITRLIFCKTGAWIWTICKKKKKKRITWILEQYNSIWHHSLVTNYDSVSPAESCSYINPSQQETSGSDFNRIPCSCMQEN